MGQGDNVLAEEQDLVVREGEDDLADGSAADSAADDSGADESGEPEIADLELEGEIAADYIEGLLDVADLDGDIDMDVEGDRAVVSVVGATLDELVGSRGEVLDALQREAVKDEFARCMRENNSEALPEYGVRNH